MWEGDKLNKYGFTEDENINGLFRFSGGINCDMHPKKIITSKNSIKFFYDSDGKEVIRQFNMERDSNGDIIAFTNPEGVRTEVASEE